MKQLKNRIFMRMLAAMGMTLGAGLVLFPLLLPTENYFRMMLQLLPMAVIIAILLVFPLHVVSMRLAKKIQYEKKQAAFSVEPTIPTIIDIPTEIPAPPKPAPRPARLPKPRAPRPAAKRPAAQKAAEAVSLPEAEPETAAEAPAARSGAVTQKRRPRRKSAAARTAQPAEVSAEEYTEKEKQPVP